MTTIVNTPPPAKSSAGPLMMIIALIVLLVLVYLGFVYGLPALRQTKSAGPQINVPDEIDINVNNTKE